MSLVLVLGCKFFVVLYFIVLDRFFGLESDGISLGGF